MSLFQWIRMKLGFAVKPDWNYSRDGAYPPLPYPIPDPPRRPPDPRRARE